MALNSCRLRCTVVLAVQHYGMQMRLPDKYDLMAPQGYIFLEIHVLSLLQLLVSTAHTSKSTVLLSQKKILTYLSVHQTKHVVKITFLI